MPHKQRGGGRKQHQRAGKEGGRATSEKYGVEFYQEIGRMGGMNSPTKFTKGSRRAREAGRKGGSK